MRFASYLAVTGTSQGGGKDFTTATFEKKTPYSKKQSPTRSEKKQQRGGAPFPATERNLKKGKERRRRAMELAVTSLRTISHRDGFGKPQRHPTQVSLSPSCTEVRIETAGVTLKTSSLPIIRRALPKPPGASLAHSKRRPLDDLTGHPQKQTSSFGAHLERHQERITAATPAGGVTGTPLSAGRERKLSGLLIAAVECAMRSLAFLDRVGGRDE